MKVILNSINVRIEGSTNKSNVTVVPSIVVDEGGSIGHASYLVTIVPP